MNENKGSFLDTSTIIAIIIVGCAWFGWQSYMNKKYPNLNKPVAEQGQPGSNLANETPTTSGTNTAAPQETAAATGTKIKSDEIGSLTVQKENFLTYSDDIWSFTVSSKGMGIKELQIKNYTDRKEEFMRIGKAETPLTMSTSIVGRRAPIDFNIQQIEDGQIYGEALVRGMKIIKTIFIDSENYTLNTQVRVEQVGDDFAGLVTFISDKIDNEIGSTSLLQPSYEHQEFFIAYDDTDDRQIITPGEALETQSFTKVNVAALGTQYFTQAILNKSSVLPEFKSVSLNDTVFGTLTHKILNRNDSFNVEYTTFIGPKKYDLLASIDSSMTGIIDFGWFNTIAKYILVLMKFFYGLVGNWGIAIILLTILVRVIVMPFNIMSYKSMKNMSKIQPLLKEIQAKYKDDPMVKNQKTMELMKEHKANPLGGCLPMFLQIPIFFALYRVLGSSIDLYKAPFGFWIHDLSLKDPFYVLPVLMGVTFFLQQKITPSTMEPAQKKIMMFMPIFFSLLMLSLPSGLTLYIFVSALFGVVQQYWFMRDRAPKAELASV